MCCINKISCIVWLLLFPLGAYNFWIAAAFRYFKFDIIWFVFLFITSVCLGYFPTSFNNSILSQFLIKLVFRLFMLFLFAFESSENYLNFASAGWYCSWKTFRYKMQINQNSPILLIRQLNWNFDCLKKSGNSNSLQMHYNSPWNSTREMRKSLAYSMYSWFPPSLSLSMWAKWVRVENVSVFWSMDCLWIESMSEWV